MKRWPIIRHIRWLYYNHQLLHWWKHYGQHFWLTPNDADFEFLNDVWNGKV
jgi:hypothetical protein